MGVEAVGGARPEHESGEEHHGDRPRQTSRVSGGGAGDPAQHGGLLLSRGEVGMVTTETGGEWRRYLFTVVYIHLYMNICQPELSGHLQSDGSSCGCPPAEPPRGRGPAPGRPDGGGRRAAARTRLRRSALDPLDHGPSGVSPTALYLHFESKEELIRAVSIEAFQDLWDFLRGAAEAHEGDPRAQLRAPGLAYIDFAERRPGHYRILFVTPADGLGGPPGPAEEDPGTAALELLLGAAAQAVKDGRDPELVARQLWIGVHGFVTLRLALPQLDWPEPTIS